MKPWVFWLAGTAFAAGSLTLLIGKLFFEWPIDTFALLLYLFIWIPAILPSLRRFKYKDVEVEFVERVKHVEKEVAVLANQSEIERESKTPTEFNPYQVRLRYTSERVDEKYFRVRVWVEGPSNFLEQVQSVTFERHPTFKNRFWTVTTPPFEDSFRCWGEFTVRVEIRLKDGRTLRRQKYLALKERQDSADSSAGDS